MKKSATTKINESNTAYVNLLESQKELRDLVYLCSQEIGFLLGVLNGHLQLSQSQEHRSEVSKTTDRLLLLIRNLKVFSQTTAVTAEIHDISQILLDSIDQVEKEIQEKGIRLTVLAEAGSYCKVDSEIMATVFTNLALFASNALPVGSEIHVSLKHSQNEIRIEFLDNAANLTVPEAEHIFHPHALRENNPNLSHLCLAPSVAKCALESQGGKFEVFPSQMGTNFLISLPFESSKLNSLPFPQKRRAKRIQTHLTCALTGNYQEAGTSIVSVLSTLGAYIKIPKYQLKQEPELQKEISLNLNLFGGTTLKIERAKIMNLHAADGYYGVGVEFMEVEEKAKVFLAEITRCNIS